MKKLVLISLCALLAANPAAAMSWQTAKKYVKPAAKATAALGCFATAYYMGKKALVELEENDIAYFLSPLHVMFGVKEGERPNFHMPETHRFQNPLLNDLDFLCTNSSAIAAVLATALGGWLTWSAYKDVQNAHSENN